MSDAVEAWEELFRAQVAMMRELRHDPAFTQMSMGEYDVLVAIRRHGGWVRPRDLTCHLLMSQPSLSRTLDRLADRGLIERRPACGDQRGVEVKLSADGARAHGQVGRTHAKTIERLMGADLNSSELAQLAQLTRKLRSSLPSPI